MEAVSFLGWQRTKLAVGLWLEDFESIACFEVTVPTMHQGEVTVSSLISGPHIHFLAQTWVRHEWLQTSETLEFAPGALRCMRLQSRRGAVKCRLSEDLL